MAVELGLGLKEVLIPLARLPRALESARPFGQILGMGSFAMEIQLVAVLKVLATRLSCFGVSPETLISVLGP
jgi:hypothetical protein